MELPHEPAEQGDAANGPPSAQAEVTHQDAPAAAAEHDPKTEHPVVSAFRRAAAEALLDAYSPGRYWWRR
ncbi:MAG TPA: hypothetical protein VNA25_19315 [Phycisphaerae bacterium]|nr:hypothetical protein [Phycisphaerae bacterium]